MNFMAVAEKTVASTLLGVLPITAILFGFQFLIIRRRPANLRKIIIGFVYVVVGLTLFLVGLEIGIFPIGESMAEKLSQPDKRAWTLLFAVCIGYSTTMAEPALMAIAAKAEEISAGGLPSFYLRNAVALGVAAGLALGVYRIFSGGPLWVYILAGYVVTVILTFAAPREIVPLAYDSGGVTTSTITVPLVTALGLGLASHIPGRNPMIDGFGLIAFASVFPMISVLSYSIIANVKQKLRNERR